MNNCALKNKGSEINKFLYIVLLSRKVINHLQSLLLLNVTTINFRAILFSFSILVKLKSTSQHIKTKLPFQHTLNIHISHTFDIIQHQIKYSTHFNENMIHWPSKISHHEILFLWYLESYIFVFNYLAIYINWIKFLSSVLYAQ